MPKYRRDEAVVIDIGSGNTKACYTEAAFTSGEQMRAFELLPFGTVSLTKHVQKTMKPGESGFADFLAVLAADVQFRIVPELTTKKQNNPGLGNLSRVYLIGGIVYAASTLVHPERSAENWVRLSPRDFETLMNRFKRQRGFEIDLSRIPEAQTGRRDHARKQALRVKSLFSEEQMAAGLSLLGAMTDQLRFERKALFFASVGRDAWRAQYLVDKIAGTGLAAGHNRSLPKFSATRRMKA
ncbi:MAG: hypothetical protein HC850_15105 [Rhodomicrobium sp.]|nr:hypothetical protein [Rhodomicrobium sp.]